MATVAGKKVLVVEDDDSLQPAIERLLDAAGCGRFSRRKRRP